MNALTRRFATLRWRLMLSCFVAAFTAMMTLAVAFFLVPGVVALFTPQHPTALAQDLQPLARRIAPLYARTPPDLAPLRATLAGYKDPILITQGLSDQARGRVTVIPGENAALFALDAHGRVLAQVAPRSATSSDFSGIAQETATLGVVQNALRNTKPASALVQALPSGQTVAATPVLDAEGDVVGALLIAVDLTRLARPFYLSNLLAIAPTAVLFALIASVFGAIFGLLTARGLIRRLYRLTAAAGAWSQGDFAVSARDPSNDELGQLARDLNRMAERLQILLRDQQRLAVVEERNRLARELHDSVKQQLFALTMLVGSAQLEVDEGSEARRILTQAQRITTSAQQEMTALIQALRPVALANRDLGTALRELCREWEERYGITCALDMPAPLTMDRDAEQEIFRVAQEALANIAKHSGATRVDIRAEDDHGMLALRIRDNGHGFDVAGAEGRGLGLGAMRERLTRLDGTLHISSSLGGTTIEARAPLAQRETETLAVTDSSSAAPER